MANSINTNFSQASIHTQKLIDKVSIQSESKLSQMQGFLNDEKFKASWEGIGLYLSRQMRFGRAIKIANFGTFTFSNPKINLDVSSILIKGVTNPKVHDKKPIDPIFLISKQFVKGMEIKAGISTEFGLRPISIQSLLFHNERCQSKSTIFYN